MPSGNLSIQMSNFACADAMQIAQCSSTYSLSATIDQNIISK